MSGKQKQLKKYLKGLKGKRGKIADRINEDIHDEVFEEYDCLSCANCCKSIPPMVSNIDAKRIAKFLGMKLDAFQTQFTVIDDDGDQVMKRTPCHFLNTDNTCQIYEVRPKACRAYPHTDESPFSAKLKLHAKNIEVCPAAEIIVERMMGAMK